MSTFNSRGGGVSFIVLATWLSLVVLTVFPLASPVLAGNILASRGSIATGSEIIRFDPHQPISSTNPSILGAFTGVGHQAALDISGHRFFLDARGFDGSRLIMMDMSKATENIMETGLVTTNPAFSGYQWDAKTQSLLAVRSGKGMAGSQVVTIDPHTFQATTFVTFSETGPGNSALDSNGHFFVSLGGQLFIVDTATREVQQTGIRTSWHPCHEAPSPIQFGFQWDKTTDTLLSMRAVFECFSDPSAPVFPRFVGNELVRLKIASGQSAVLARIEEGGIGSSAFDPEGQQLYVRVAGQLVVFNTATGQVVRTGLPIADWQTFQWEPGCSPCSFTVTN